MLCARLEPTRCGKLVVPRVLAGVFMAPVLTVVANTVGIIGGWLIAVFQLRVASASTGRRSWTACLADAWMGLIKPFCLGFVIVTIGCHVGLRTTWRNAGRRSRHYQCRRGIVGGGDCCGLFHHASVDHVAQSMTSATEPYASPTGAVEPDAPIVVFDDVSLAFDDAVVPKHQLHPAGRPYQNHPGRQRRRKSTTLKLILGLLTPDSGVICKWPPHRPGCQKPS